MSLRKMDVLQRSDVQVVGELPDDDDMNALSPNPEQKKGVVHLDRLQQRDAGAYKL